MSAPLVVQFSDLHDDFPMRLAINRVPNKNYRSIENQKFNMIHRKLYSVAKRNASMGMGKAKIIEKTSCFVDLKRTASIPEGYSRNLDCLNDEKQKIDVEVNFN
uniref:Uncharacterized protein n=1 Tax=Romanomermis culicivorax TaxID=13658 RepID=A0A915HI52_ROMCU